ncbi:MAG TPA: hypothetical protein VGX03_16465 [Candidatus Binatia bacterium]|nr:hypothetical protein [Candidatus Binatia bacterium]
MQCLSGCLLQVIIVSEVGLARNEHPPPWQQARSPWTVSGARHMGQKPSTMETVARATSVAKLRRHGVDNSVSHYAEGVRLAPVGASCHPPAWARVSVIGTSPERRPIVAKSSDHRAPRASIRAAA